MKKFLWIISTLLIFSSACGVSAPETQPVDLNALQTQTVATIRAQAEQTAQAIPPATETPPPTATAIRTPPALPSGFTTDELNPLDTPHTYIQDSCQYLKDKWSSTNAAPGTTVMVIMIHSVVKGNATDYNAISVVDFKRLTSDLYEQEFQAITTQQLADFLYHNAKIPPRSVVLIQDDRHSAENFNDHFRPLWDKWKWPVVSSWINAQDTIGKTYLPENVALKNEGWVDYQAHGVVHNTPIDSTSSDDYILSELQGAMDIMTRDFGKAPIAYIWPGGGFTPHAVSIARQVGYKLGFSINPRGPLMFNWVPLSESNDAMRPSYLPEGNSNDPLLTLPRYWVTDARQHIDTVRAIGQSAQAYAEANKAVELEYYEIVCAPTYGAMP